MSHHGDSFDPLASHKPVPPRPTGQEALDAVLVACDALEESGDLETSQRIRWEIETRDDEQNPFISVDYDWRDRKNPHLEARAYAMRYRRPWNMGDPVPVPFVRADGTAVVRMMREVPRTWRETGTRPHRWDDDIFDPLRRPQPVDFERREVIYNERVRLAGDETVLEHRHIWFQERP